MEESPRKTLYREDSLGGEQNRVRPRGYSFEDLIDDDEESVHHKLAKTGREQVRDNQEEVSVPRPLHFFFFRCQRR